MKGFLWVKLHDLAFKMNKKWLFSLETGKHNNYSYFHVFKFVHSMSIAVQIGYFYRNILICKILTTYDGGGRGQSNSNMLTLLIDSPLS